MALFSRISAPRALRLGLICAGCIFALALLANRLVNKSGFTSAALTAQEIQPPAPGSREAVRMTVLPGSWFGYRDREFLKNANNLGLRSTKDAWDRFMAKGVADGPYVPLRPGEEVFFVDIDIPAGMTKIRRKGETDGWWTNVEALTVARPTGG